jgi:hypothetical protein
MIKRKLDSLSGFVAMSQPSEFIESPRKCFGGGEATVEFLPALLADWLWWEAECFEGCLTPEVLVEGDFVEIETGCAEVEDVWNERRLLVFWLARKVHRAGTYLQYRGEGEETLSTLRMGCLRIPWLRG